MKQLRYLMFIVVIVLLTACSGNGDGSNSSNSGAQSAEDLTLEDGQFYTIQATGAFQDTYTAENWGGEWQTRRLFEDGLQNEYWTLRISGNNGVDDSAVSLIHLVILKDIDTGTYPIAEGNFLSSPDADEPVKVVGIEVRYPDYQILNNAEEVEGTITFDSISDEGMSGTMTITLNGDGGEVNVLVAFDVPVTGRLEQ